MNEKQKLEEMVESGFTISKIGENLTKSDSSVRRLLKKYNLKTKRFIDKNKGDFKKCRYCYKKKSIEEFPIAGEINGVVYKRCKCKVCYHEMKGDKKKEIANWVAQLKKNLKCNKCNNNDFRVLEFHHLRDKEFNIADAAAKGCSKDTILKEISKCEVLCSNCHKIETYENRKKKKHSPVAQW